MLVWVHSKHATELLLMLAGAIPAHASDVALQAALTRSSSASCTGGFSLSEGRLFVQLEKKCR